MYFFKKQMKVKRFYFPYPKGAKNTITELSNGELLALKQAL